MRKLNICKTLVALILAVSVVLLVFYDRDEIHSSAVESVVQDSNVHTEVYFADEGTDGVATGTDAGAEIASAGSENSITSGGLVYYAGAAYTRFYTVRRTGTDHRAYCGDHNKNAVRSTNNVSFSENDDIMLRLAFACGPDGEYEWGGFRNKSENDVQLIMALTLNYLRHGQYYPVISEYLDYINSMDKKSVFLKSNETRLSLVVEGDEGGEVQSVSLGNYRRYTIPGTKTVRNRTKLFRLKGESGNYIEIGVPGHSWIHVKRPGDKTYSIYKTGNVIIHVGDRVFFTSAVSYTGKEGMTYAEGKSGLTVYTADSNDTNLDQQLLFAEHSDKSAVSLDLDWSDDGGSGYMWITKNKKYNEKENCLQNMNSYSADIYGAENYSYKGIVYDVRDKNGSNVFRFVLSYNGMCYADKATGRQVVFGSKTEKEEYSNALDISCAKLPFGAYEVSENEYLWDYDNKTGKLKSTGKKVVNSGYKYNPKVYKAELTEKTSVRSMATAYHIAAEDDVVTGRFGLKKTDADTQEPVKNAVYYVVRKASGSITSDQVVAKLKTDGCGIGIVYASKYGSTNTPELTGLPIGTYEIYEKKAPAGYEKNEEKAVLKIKASGSTLSAGEKISSDSEGNAIVWNTSDKKKGGKIDFSIYKQDASTGIDAQGEAELKGAEFTVNYYDGMYGSLSELPDRPDKTWILETDRNGICMLQKKYLSASKKSDETVIDENGNIELAAGTITIKETKPPVGYILEKSVIRNGDTGERITDAGEGICLTNITNKGQSVSLEIGNELIVGNRVIRGDFQFSKKAADTGRTMAGVKFLLENNDRSESIVIYTDENGFYSSSASYIRHTFDTNSGKSGCGIWFGDENTDDDRGALPYGTYHLSELRCDANSGKYRSAETITFTIDSDSKVIDIGDIINERFAEMDSVAKFRDTGGKNIPESAAETVLVDTVIMSGLEIGHVYTISGQVLDKDSEQVLEQAGAVNRVEFTAKEINQSVDVPFVIDVTGLGGRDLVCYEVLTDATYEGEVIASHQDIKSEGQTVHVGEKRLEISKTAVTGSDELSGAELVLADSTGKVVDRWITGKTAHIVENIKPGEYTLSERSAPAGYLKSREITFTVDDDYGTQKVRMIDEIAKIRIKKVDDVGNKPLGGVRFTLYSAESGEKVDSKMTDKKGYLEFEYVSPGEYYLVEDNIPEGYMAVDADSEGHIKVTVKSGQYENEPVRIVKNHYGSVYIYKKSADDGAALCGAEFGLYEKLSDKLVMKAVSGDDGYAEFKQIPAGKYYIKELKAPEGYEHRGEATEIDTGEKIYNKENPVIFVNEKENTTTETTDTTETTKTTEDKTTEMTRENKSPETGDGAPLVLTVVFIVMAALLSAGLLIYRKKFPKNEDLQ